MTEESPFKRLSPEPSRKNTATQKRETAQSYKPYVEPPSTLAEGLPAWNLEPPGEMVRRHEKK